jgi:biotin transport system substrate-specific component
MSTVAHTLGSWATRDVVVDPRARSGVGVAAFVLAITFGAQVAIPLWFTPVPITLQTLFVILGGVVLGPRLGALAAASYVMVGAAGAPVFSNGAAGVLWLFGPTGGYLLAAPAAAFAAGLVAGGARGSALRLLAGLGLGAAVHYVGGVAHSRVSRSSKCSPWGWRRSWPGTR